MDAASWSGSGAQDLVHHFQFTGVFVRKADAAEQIDPVTNTEVWRVPSQGGNGGTLSTGPNLVFRGSGHRLIAHDARTGEELWGAEVGGGTATPMTYELDGVQYVSIAGGSTRQGPRVWTFVLDGAAERP